MQIPACLASKMAQYMTESLVRRSPHQPLSIYMVRVERLELPCLSAVEPKSTASTNSAIPALRADRHPSSAGPIRTEAASITPVMKIARKNRAERPSRPWNAVLSLFALTSPLT